MQIKEKLVMMAILLTAAIALLIAFPLEEFTQKRGINVITRTSVNAIDRKNRELVLSNDSTFCL